MPLSACTIVAKNYIAFARVLARSFHEHHPDGRFYVLLVDRNDGYLDPEAEPFELLEVEDLPNLPLQEGETQARDFLFKYSILELSTAVKPFLLAHLFERDTLTNLIYFDPDILITGPLEPLAEQLDAHDIVLTPHLTSPIDDGCHPSEQAILQAGSNNLGFIALARSTETDRLLTWWQERLTDKCRVRVDEGLFVDQKWVDLVPGLFAGVHIHRHPGWNVAYWNLHGREVTLHDDGPRSNGERLMFFHFSGIQPGALEHVSKHQDRFTLAQIGGAAELYRSYSEALIEAGFFDAQPWPYAFNAFESGVRIPAAAREIYSALGTRRQRFGDPFRDGDGSFLAWLDGPERGHPAQGAPYLSRLLARLWAQRDDLRRLFPDPAGTDFPDFCAWLEGFGRYEMKLDDAFLGHLHRDSAASRWKPSGLKRRAKNRLKRIYHSPTGAAGRRVLKRLLGPTRYGQLKERMRPDEAATATATVRPVGAYRPPVPQRLADAGGFGVNVIGYLTAETGMGEAARGLARALERAGVPTALHDLELNVLARREDRSVISAADEVDSLRYGINLVVANADQAVPIYEHLGGAAFAGRYNVGFWLWELETFPSRWRGSFDLFHEVWTPSSFCVDAISELAPVPVRRVPLPVEVPNVDAAPRFGRERFSLPGDSFVILFMFNFLSYMERKNPLALVRAFRRAFTAEDDTLLLLKTSQSDFAPEALAALKAEIGDARVEILDEYLSRDEIHALISCSDAYASLHRSEGFGLTIAESMARGKPVVATPYSGNADFFDLNNGFPVRYRRVEITEDAGPYPAGSHWAEPDVEHAAELLRQIYDQRGEPSAVAERAREDVAQRLGVDAVAEVLGRRVREVAGRCGGGEIPFG